MDLVVVHFPTGAIALTRSGEMLAKPSVRVPAEEIAGANGAGDAFAAGILLPFWKAGRLPTRWRSATLWLLRHCAGLAQLTEFCADGSS